VDTPAPIFKTKGDAYRGKIVSIDTSRAQNVVVVFQDDPKLKYFFPVTSVVKWLVDPCNYHPDDEELLRTGINIEDTKNDPVSESDDEKDDAGGEEDSEPLDGAAAVARLEPLHERHARKNPQSKKRPSAKWQRLLRECSRAGLRMWR
jgi:hypothetical protein